VYKQGRVASRQALLRFIMTNYSFTQDEKKVNTHLRLALNVALEKGLLLQWTGKGASGSVKLNTQAVTAGSTKAATAKMPKAAPAVKKPKTTTAAKVSSIQKVVKPKQISLGSGAGKAKKPLKLAKKPSLTKKSTVKVVTKPKSAAKKATAAKPKAAIAKVAKPKVTKAAAGKAKKSAKRK